MSEENKITEDLERSTIKQLRKERKLLKKNLKREERIRENDKKKLELKLAPKDQHIIIISRDVADNIRKTNGICVNRNSEVDLNNTNDNFPVLNTRIKIKQKQVDETSVLSPTIKSDFHPKQSKTNTLTINLADILIKEKPNVNTKTNKEVIQKYDGNILDSSQPIRYKGKQRENPKPRPPSKLKAQIIVDLKECDTSRIILNICENIITDELNTVVKDFLSNIVRFQENLYKRDPIKGTGKRRYITGFREVKKFLLVKKIKCVIFAPDIKNIVENGALETTIRELISLASKSNVPYVFALSRRKLGHITLKNVPISCVGIFYYDGAEQSYKELLTLLKDLRKGEETIDQQENK